MDKQTLKRGFKYRYEFGYPLVSQPEVFYFPRPKIVPDPWVKRDLGYLINAAWQTPARAFKKILFPKKQHGY